MKNNTTIVPYNGDSQGSILGYQLGFQPMEPWPSLAGKAFCLSAGPGSNESLFFYDSAPSGDFDPSQPFSVPVFVLIHGLGDEADSWRHLIPLLNSWGYRVLAPDLPGFGRSTVPGKMSIKGYADAVLKLLEATVRQPGPGGRMEAPVFLVGSSMGALVAEEAALKKPGRFSPPADSRGLILLDGSIPGGPANPGVFALAKLLFSRKWYRAYRKNPEGAWASLYPYYADLDAMPPGDKDFLRRRVMARVESKTQEQAFFAIQRSLIRAYLLSSSRFARKIQRYKGKILLLWGEKDKIIPLSSAETFKSLRPDINLQIIPGAGHLPHQEKPEETARLIADFVKS